MKVRLVIGKDLILRYVCETMSSLKEQDLLFKRKPSLNNFYL